MKRLARIVYGRLAVELGALDVVVQLRSSPRGRDNAELFKELERVMRGLLQDGAR